MRRQKTHVTIPMIARMRALAGAGLGCEAIAAVIELDYGQRPCRYTVARYVGRTGGLGLRTVHAGSFGEMR